MQIQNEDELLDSNVRRKIIEAIEGQENRRRKDREFKRYQCYKDQTDSYVAHELLQQFDPDTVREMNYALSNVSFVRKVIDKLSRVYKYGVDRELWQDNKQLEQETEILKRIVDETDADKKFKKCNRFFKLFKNVVMYVRPKPDKEEKQKICLDPLAPYLYDVVEKSNDRELPLCYILSDYSPSIKTSGANATQAVVPGTTGRDGKSLSAQIFKGDGIDQVIADDPNDKNSKEYVFWSDSYHFVCNKKGELKSDATDIENPIKEMPFVNYAEDQDGAFWAIGGDDLINGGVLINSMITNVIHIGVTQGYGQIVMTGKELPRNVKSGPNKAILLPDGPDGEKSTFDFKSANPPLDSLRGLIEMYVALLLTTNNLSTSGVQSQLGAGVAYPSAIAMVIDKAESMEDVEDQRQVFIDNEPLVWDLYSKWQTLLAGRDELNEDLKTLTLPEDFDLRLKFGIPKPIESEKERLDVLKLKKDMGIISNIDMIKAENDSLTDEEAEKKLADILEQKMKNVTTFMGGKPNESNESQSDGAGDIGDNRPGSKEPLKQDED